ncbi:hypothetical protein ONZ51_g11576 [Trametes cubensis]|uniref:Uncharacterized protein n=1 Tax=Trametes cubensis TaxID=1111947 RepID=A0AAD7TK52_9APHY|nr:hypothetical protein ONZ51_g11576 [Trametes cubensis]
MELGAMESAGEEQADEVSQENVAVPQAMDTDASMGLVPEAAAEAPRTRAGRRIRPTWKLRDALPEDVGATLDNPIHEDAEALPSDESGSRSRAGPRLVLLATDYVRTVANTFGLRRFYKRRPHRPPQARTDLEACYAPTANVAAAKKKSRSVAEIIFPFPNISSWRFSWHYTNGYKKTQADRDGMQTLVNRPDFCPADIAGVDFRKLDELVASGACEEAPWSNEREGWRTTSVTIGVPSGKRATQASRREAASAARRVNRHEPAEDTPPIHAIPGQHFTVADFHHKNLCAEIKKTLSSDPAAHDFVYDPHLVELHTPASPTHSEQVYGELYNSPSFVQADLRLQNSAPEPGCSLPRAIAAIMLWSDATVVSQFGNQKVWPAYMYFGNQSKYTRARPTARAAHHIAYFTSLPDRVQDFIRAQHGKSASAPLLTHCRRELFHAQWKCLLDDEFMHAYEHGMIVDCIDGVRRRIYPRIFTYSADYPEKMLVATLRDKGRCPCPHCLVTFEDIDKLGNDEDRNRRSHQVRESAAEQSALVQEAREIIYDSGYVVNSDRVEALLRDHSLVPTINAFSRLQELGFNIQDALVVDQLHEFELGVWKAVFSHLVRILEAAGSDLVNELNERFRQVPPFALDTIRKFANNICEMKQMAARDFEDILQCIIPCFEGLLPDDAHGDAVLTLLYVCAYWHALAKMRMHTDTSLQLLDDATAVLGHDLRHFAGVTCAAYNTRETQAEYEARKRAEARRVAASSATSASVAQDTGRRLRRFNLRTIKMHFLGDYVSCIKKFGTSDSYTTQTGEHEHRRVKARWERTNGVRAGQQVVNIDARESRMHAMAHELSDLGLDIPGLVSHSADVANPSSIPPEHHHHIGSSDKNFIGLREWQSEHPDDPFVETFVPRLKEHLRQRLQGAYPSLANTDVPIIIHHDRIYEHATVNFNYTTYDLRREQDIVHPSMGKSDILVHTPSACDDPPIGYPWSYARVLGIHHTLVHVPGEHDPLRIEFLHVRWFETDTDWTSGSETRRLERISFVPWTSGDAFGFVDPMHVIRACHLVPAFRHGRTAQYLPPNTLYQVPGGDWMYFYVNRFVDRDMFVRHLGCGVGHLDLRAQQVERIICDGFDRNAAIVPSGSDGRVDDSEPTPETDEAQALMDEEVPEIGLDVEVVAICWIRLSAARLGIAVGLITAKSVSIRPDHPFPFFSHLALQATHPVPPFVFPESAMPATPRTHSERDSGSEDEQPRPTKRVSTYKTRSAMEIALANAGTAVGMMGDLFRDFQAILNAGVQANPNSPATALSYRERKYQDLYEHILAIIPTIAQEIAARGPQGGLLVARELEAGRLAIRSADLHGIKKAIITWDQYVPPIVPDAKSTRGFNHPECGRLLCPADHDWSDSEVRQALQNGSRKYPAGARDWPSVLWENETLDQEDLSAGFLRNRRLVMAGRHSLLGPRAAYNSLTGKVSARKPKARIYHIRSISIPFIAYTAVLVHFALSSQETFSDGTTPGTFPYEEFYQSIVRYAEEMMAQEVREDLLAWWTKQVFGIVQDEYSSEDDNADGSDGRPLSIMARMKAQAKLARIAAAAEEAHAAAASASEAAHVLAGLATGAPAAAIPTPISSSSTSPSAV